MAFTWCAWLWVHAFAAWVAWRAWVQHEPVSPVAGGSCNHVLILAALLCSVSLLTGATLLRDSRAWAAAKDGLEAAADVGAVAMQTLAFLKPATSFSSEGGRDVLGSLVTGEFEETTFATTPAFAFAVLPNVLFLGFLANLLLHYGVAQRAIAKMGYLAQLALGVTCCEAIVALANVCVGMTEAPLLVRPYVERLTRSELHCVMTVGFSTVSAAVLPVYTSLGLNTMDLIVASVLSTVAGIASSKLLYPETKLSITAYYNMDEFESPERSAVEAVVGGMATVAAMAPAIACSLFTFLSAQACVHELCSRIGKLVHIPEVTPHSLLTMLFEPLVALMGVEPSEVYIAARLLATRVLANELVAYRDLVQQPSSANLSGPL